MSVSIIVAVDEQNAIGVDNQLLCHLPADLKYFKATTQGHAVVMGRRTFRSLPNGALPNRRNIVVSGTMAGNCPNVEVVPSLTAALHLAEGEDEVFVIGGGMLYQEALPLAEKLYVTQIHHTFDKADTFFPRIDEKEWILTLATKHEADERNAFARTFQVWERKKLL